MLDVLQDPVWHLASAPTPSLSIIKTPMFMVISIFSHYKGSHALVLLWSFHPNPPSPAKYNLGFKNFPDKKLS